MTDVDVIKLRTAMLVRRGWRATVLLALLAGLAGGVAVAAWALGRRAVTSPDRLLAYADPAELMVIVCPPELVEISEENLAQCFTHDAVAEQQELSRLPEVDAAARAYYTGMSASRPTDSGRMWASSVLVVADDDLPGVEGRPVLLDGRWPTDGPEREVLVNEPFLEISGATLGEEIDARFWSPEELGAPLAGDEGFHGPEASVRIVGVVRGLGDLIATVGTQFNRIEEARIFAGPSVAEVATEAGRFGGVLVAARDGDIEAAEAAVERALASRMFNISTQFGPDETDPVADAIRYEARGTMAFALVAALAAIAFIGQAVARQARREWTDYGTLRAVGMSNREAGASAALRGAMIGGLAMVIAVGVSIALTGLGPFGVAGQAGIEHGMIVDPLVLAIGGVLVITAVTLAAWLPIAQMSGGSARRRVGAATWTGGRVATSLPPPVAVGAGMTFGRGISGIGWIGAALVSVAIAVAAVVAAAGLTASLDELTTTPEGFGVTWDLSMSGLAGNPDALEEAMAYVRQQPEVEAAAGIVGNDVRIGDEVAWVHALEPVDGIDRQVQPVVMSGRLPEAIDEVALGTATMADQGLAIGDSILINPTTTQRETPIPMTVVGTTIINDSFENSPGRGGVVDPAWTDRYVPEASADPYVIRLDPGVDVDAFRDELDERFSATVVGPVQQGAIRNVARIRPLPLLLAGVVVLLAAASLTHALFISIRRQRSQLAVLKSLGFRRSQVGTTIASHATSLAVVAIVVGVPVGILAGRRGWRMVADRLGVGSPPVTPLIVLAVIVLGALVVANLVASVPAWRAGRVRTVEALRAE